MNRTPSLVLAFSLAAAACGKESVPPAPAHSASPALAGAPAPIAPPPATPSPTASAATSAGHVRASVVIVRPDELRLGHYSSGDGLSGLVLDRTASAPRARLDGATGVVDLAVVRASERRSLLLSADGSLALEIDDRGGVKRFDQGREVRLYRDGDAEPLPEVATPVIDGARLESLNARVRARCGGNVRFELGSALSAPQQRGVSHVLERAARALEHVCRDAAGKDAVAKKVRAVRLAIAPRGKTTFEGGVLRVEDTFVGEELGPTMDELRSTLERGL